MEMSNNKQLTAVQWYAGRQHDLEGLRDVGAISPIEYYEQLTQALQKAKEMEEEQMIDFAYKALMEADSTVNRFVDVDELYNETYGGGNK